jgi:hypothetical protein
MSVVEEISGAREREKEQLRDKLEMLRRVMASKAQADGNTAALHAEKSSLLQQVAGPH